MCRVVASHHRHGDLKKFLNRFHFTSVRLSSPYLLVAKRKYTNESTSTENPPWRVMFFGSDAFAVKSLQLLCSKLRTKTLISKLDVTTSSSTGWGNEKNLVHRYANGEKLTINDWPVDTARIKNQYDIGVVVSFGHLLPVEIIDSFPLGILNVHGSLLPKWRGAAPIRHAILNGDTTTGVTIMKVTPHKFDTGGIVRQYSVAIKAHETAVELTDRLANIGARLLMDCFRDLPRSVQAATPQPDEGISYAKKITSSAALIDWKNKSAQQIYNQHRALFDIYPLQTYWFGSPVKLFNIFVDQIVGMNPQNQNNMQTLQIDPQVLPGLVEFSQKRSLLRVQCRDGKWICASSILISGKKSLSPKQFYNGYLSKVKNSLDRKFG